MLGDDRDAGPGERLAERAVVDVARGDTILELAQRDLLAAARDLAARHLDDPVEHPGHQAATGAAAREKST